MESKITSECTNGDNKTFIKDLLNMLPDRTKRWIFLSSILAVLKNVNNPTLSSDSSLIEQLEEIFSITAAPRACIFAMRIKHLIWKSIGSKTIILNCERVNVSELQNKKLTDNEINEIVTYIKNIIPSWIKYSNDEDMDNDVKLLVTQLVSI